MTKVERWKNLPEMKPISETGKEVIIIPLKKSYNLLPKTPYEIHKAVDPHAYGVTVGFIAIIVALIVMATLK